MSHVVFAVIISYLIAPLPFLECTKQEVMKVYCTKQETFALHRKFLLGGSPKFEYKRDIKIIINKFNRTSSNYSDQRYAAFDSDGNVLYKSDAASSNNSGKIGSVQYSYDRISDDYYPDIYSDPEETPCYLINYNPNKTLERKDILSSEPPTCFEEYIGILFLLILATFFSLIAVG